MTIRTPATAAASLLLVLAGCSDPVKPLPEGPAVLVEASLGTTHSCAVMSNGEMSCWGFNIDGELGPGATASHSPVPVMVPLDRPAGSAAAGVGHTCALSDAGTAFCWGSNSSGQLGDNTTMAERANPVAVGGSVRFRQLAAGSGYTCGLDLDGAGYCWGGNGGRLGDGSTTSRLVPTAVAGGMTFRTIAAGSQATCALTTAGAAYCWGGNALGSLGDGTTTSSTVPVAVSGGHVFTQLDLGSGHACGLKADGSAWCWGDATHGQMGDGRPPSTTSPSTPVRQLTPVRVASDLPFTWITAGERFACALDTTGAAWCWGYNSGGQLGDNSTTHSGAPVPVAGGLSFARIIGGGYHTCAIDAGDALYCWGDNMFGQLGVGSITAVHRSPVRVALPGEE